MTDEPARPDLPEPIEWTADEQKALSELPREADPGRLLEERTVRGLREEGLLGSSGRVDADPNGRRAHVGPSWWQAAAAVAAGIALFAGGVSVGQGMGARQAADAFQTVFQDGDALLAARVQRAGSDYVASLSALSDADGPTVADSGQAVEVALTALWAAATEIVRLAPDDPLAARILQGFEARARASAEETRSGQQLLIEF